jgi:hypothetical protein
VGAVLFLLFDFVLPQDLRSVLFGVLFPHHLSFLDFVILLLSALSATECAQEPIEFSRSHFPGTEFLVSVWSASVPRLGGRRSFLLTFVPLEFFGLRVGDHAQALVSLPVRSGRVSLLRS